MKVALFVLCFVMAFGTLGSMRIRTDAWHWFRGCGSMIGYLELIGIAGLVAAIVRELCR